MAAAFCYLLHFERPYRHAQHSTKNLKRRLAEHAGGCGARLLAVIQAEGIGWELARIWPGGRARERQLKRQGGASRRCPLCGVRPRRLPANRDGSISRSCTTDPQKLAAGVMTAAQLAEHTALRRGAVTGKPARPAERGPLAADPWLAHPDPTRPAPRARPGHGRCAGLRLTRPRPRQPTRPRGRGRSTPPPRPL